MIQYAVEEAYEAGIRDMVSVTGRSKRAIEDHFDTAYELETSWSKPASRPCWNWCAPSPVRHELPVRTPAAQPGLAATPYSAPAAGRPRPFAVLLADDLMVGENGGPGVMAQNDGCV